ncbi:MAG: hypothetical protein A4E37_01682 [Methanoregulaceae archaeon PtaB.Bin056]|jgi:energy-converting hydrogenase A subunit M|nr:MAG: hypothetical protein A4E37_01682 [Methanoregulaceae archaeon PtaB.Bin056]
MREPMYEKDLTAMKYAILESRRHDGMVREIAAEIGVPQLRMRRYLMDRFDMLLLENLPARYEQGKKIREDSPEPERQLGSHLYTHAVPIIDREAMEQILKSVREMVRKGTPLDQAIHSGRERMRKEITA